VDIFAIAQLSCQIFYYKKAKYRESASQCSAFSVVPVCILQGSDFLLTAKKFVSIYVNTAIVSNRYNINFTSLTALCLGIPGWAGTRKVKSICLTDIKSIFLIKNENLDVLGDNLWQTFSFDQIKECMMQHKRIPKWKVATNKYYTQCISISSISEYM